MNCCRIISSLVYFSWYLVNSYLVFTVYGSDCAEWCTLLPTFVTVHCCVTHWVSAKCFGPKLALFLPVFSINVWCPLKIPAGLLALTSIMHLAAKSTLLWSSAHLWSVFCGQGNINVPQSNMGIISPLLFFPSSHTFPEVYWSLMCLLSWANLKTKCLNGNKWLLLYKWYLKLFSNLKTVYSGFAMWVTKTTQFLS